MILRSSTGQTPKRMESRDSSRYLYARVHISIVHNRQWKQPTHLLIEEWVNKMWCVRTVKLIKQGGHHTEWP